MKQSKNPVTKDRYLRMALTNKQFFILTLLSTNAILKIIFIISLKQLFFSILHKTK